LLSIYNVLSIQIGLASMNSDILYFDKLPETNRVNNWYCIYCIRRVNLDFYHKLTQTIAVYIYLVVVKNDHVYFQITTVK